MTNSHRGGGLTVLEAAAVHGSNLYVGMMVFALAIFVFAIKHQEKKAPSFFSLPRTGIVRRHLHHSPRDHSDV